MKLIDKYKKIQEIGTEVVVPWNIWRFMGNENGKTIFIWGDQISLGEDFGSLEQVREAIAWYVEQLGGKVKWEK